MFNRFAKSTLKFFGQPNVLKTMQGQSLFKDHTIQHVTMAQKPTWQHDTSTRMMHTLINIGRLPGADKADKLFFFIPHNNDSLGKTRNIHESKELMEDKSCSAKMKAK
jgi:hypothetical protein